MARARFPRRALDDPERVSMLLRSGILDTPAEDSFDRFTRLATRALHVPVALVSLVEGHRQFFKSCVGLPRPWATARETPLSHSFCQYVVTSAEPLVIEDARDSALVRDNLAVRDLNVIAYAGFPIVVRPGVVLGSFCVIDDKPRRWTEAELHVVRELASAVAVEIELRLDVADQAEAIEDNLRELTSIVDSSSDAITGGTLDGIIVSWNAGAEQLYGYTAAEVLGRSISLIVPPDRPDETPRILERVRRGESVAQYETRRVCKDGSIIDILLTVSPIRDATGRVLGVSAVGRDISERKRAQELIRLSEERFRFAAEATRDVIWDYDVATGAIVWSDAVESVLGHPRAAEMDIGWWSRQLHPDDAGRTLESLQHALAGDAEVWTHEYRLRHGGGGYAVIEGQGRIVRNESGAAVRIIGALQDVTERRVSEERLMESQRQLMQAQRIDAIGRLSAGVAHDFNNLLTVIMGSGEFLEMDLPPGDASLEDVRAIREAASRAADLTRQLLAFSRNQVARSAVLDLNEAIRAMDRMSSRLIGENIAREMVLDPGIGPVRLDPTQLEQVLLNLIVNARDAMPVGGSLRIRSFETELDPAEAHGGGFTPAPGRYVGLAVSDTGVGIDPDTRGRIFEPFFTTKEVGKGTGLGLSTVYGIVKQAGGYMTVESEPGRGTTMSVHLPLSSEPDAPPAEPPADAPSTGGTVLLVEDDPVVLGTVRKMLTRSGHAVLEASSAEEALRILEARAAGVDLVLTDVVMPGIGGGALVRHLAECHPRIAVICMSGYTDDVIAPHGVVRSRLRLIQKPFSQQELTRAISAALRG